MPPKTKVKTTKPPKSDVANQVAAANIIQSQPSQNVTISLQQTKRPSEDSSGTDHSDIIDPDGNTRRRRSDKVKVESGKTSEIIVYHRFKDRFINLLINSEQRPKTDVPGWRSG